jgi:hypothetical protein
MIKLSGVSAETGLPMVGVGLTRACCEALLASGQSLRFSTVDMPGSNLPAIEILVFAGETEEAMAFSMVKSGTLDVTQIHDERPLADLPVRPADKNWEN